MQHHPDNHHSPPDKETTQFVALLSRHHRRWRFGRMLQSLLQTIGIAVVGIMLIGVIDRFLPIAPTIRMATTGIGIIVLLLLFSRGVRRAARIRMGATASRLDCLLHDRRHTLLTAYELQRTQQDRKALGDYLVARSVAAALQRIRPLPTHTSLPSKGIKRQLRILGVQTIVALSLVALNPQAARTILMRITFPTVDTPPYSHYQFTITPANPQTVYGGHLELAVTIDGAEIRDPVFLLTRGNGPRHRTACFQESTNRFAQRLEHLVTPVQFAFTTGNARSRWQQADLLVQPRIANAILTVTPPAYTKLPPQQFAAGSQPLQGIRGTRVELLLTSNRPLLDGQATITPREDHYDTSHTGSQRQNDLKHLKFEWVLDHTADIAISLRDIQGTATATPFNLFQQRLPDTPPNIRLYEPQPFSLATPSATLAIKGEATDDLGLRHVDLIQALIGYRDRAQPIKTQTSIRTATISEQLNLGTLGVKPGDTLEFYAEALDTHPGKAGLSVSDIVRVQIISDREYANMLRMKINLREFTARYRVAEQTLQALREALADLEQAEDDETERLLEAAVNKANTAADTLRRLADDFPVFEMEKSLSKDLEEVADTVAHARAELAATTPDNPRLGAMARHWQQALGPAIRKTAAHRKQAEQVAEIAALMESAIRFRQLVERQETLVRSLARYEHEPVGADTTRLQSLGYRQAAIHKELLEVLAAIEQNAANLPESAADFGETARKMAETLKAADPMTPMQNAKAAADNADGRQTHHQAKLALERLQQSSQRCKNDSGFGSLCQGGSVPGLCEGDMQETLEQMLAAMIQRLLGKGGGEGPTPSPEYGGSGAGLGGDRSTGFWMRGNSPLNIPVRGPARSRFTTTTGARGEHGRGGNAGSTQRVSGRATLDNQPQTAPDSQALPRERIPAAYRNAIRRYFDNP